MSSSFTIEDDFGPSCRALFDAMPAGVLVQDKNGKIFDANLAAQKILGLSLKQLSGSPMPDPAWRVTREDGRELPVSEYPAAQALRTGQVVRSAVIGMFLPNQEHQ